MSESKSAPIDFAADKARALKLTPVSRETEKRLAGFVELLLLWQRKTNLVANSTLPQIWSRHIADSLQLLGLAPDAKVWIDLGSGGGFPGVPLAGALAETGGAMIHLVESNGKKAAFLREAVRKLGLPAEVHQQRIENIGESFSGKADVVTARALAPLKVLCGYAFRFIEQGALGLFPKGQDIEAELTEAAKYWKLEAEQVSSLVNPEGRIVVIRGLVRRNKP
ncbi:MAG TPA: 16S rRNA (guanine(527)-N(7))-methyltransferase RsmG [Pseudolabrys sp.]|nr:16S rRNA (guanine(527)-N(7))-methyltransferase RsmG [Pseudolabrys sp.]